MPGFTYKSYNFRDKDPIIDEIRTIYQESGANYVWVHEHSGVSAQTLVNWFSGATKRPQAATVNAVLRSLGYKLGIVPHEGGAVKVILPKAASARHVVAMAKYKRAKR